MSGVACNHIPWTTHAVESLRACHAIVVFGYHTWSDDVSHGIPACTLGRKHGHTTSSVACHHRPWTTYKVKQRRLWHVIIALGQNTRSDGVGRGMQSYTLDCTYGRKTLIVSCYHLLWTSHTVERRQALHAHMSLGQQTRSDNAGQGMPSSPLDNIQGKTTSRVACYHYPWTEHTARKRLE